MVLLNAGALLVAEFLHWSIFYFHLRKSSEFYFCCSERKTDAAARCSVAQWIMGDQVWLLSLLWSHWCVLSPVSSFWSPHLSVSFRTELPSPSSGPCSGNPAGVTSLNQLLNSPLVSARLCLQPADRHLSPLTCRRHVSGAVMAAVRETHSRERTCGEDGILKRKEKKIEREKRNQHGFIGLGTEVQSETGESTTCNINVTSQPVQVSFTWESNRNCKTIAGITTIFRRL